MTQEDIIELAHQASKEWLKELPTPWETANQVPKRFLEIFAKLTAAKKREECAKIADKWAVGWPHSSQVIAEEIRARGQA